MHPHRRRKKRPTYGVRTVEINRGINGFGFTISGQAPCILSCIISGSPAERAGLRPGDYLIAVNGQNVSKALHDDVVELIGTSKILKLQIAENYYSDSSEEENVTTFKLRPKCSSKVKHRQLLSSINRAEKVVQDLQTGALFSDQTCILSISPEVAKNVDICSNGLFFKELDDHLSTHHEEMTAGKESPLLECVYQKALTTHFLNSLDAQVTTHFLDKSYDTGDVANDIFQSLFTEHDLNQILCSSVSPENGCNDDHSYEKAVLRAVVGYLGTVEMPKETQVTISRLQTIRNCIRRLQIEKKVHTHVLMTFYPQSIRLTNMQGSILAEFSAEKITFCGVYSDNKNFFGLVTTHQFGNEELNDNCGDSTLISNSCHIFMIDPRLVPHDNHSGKAKTFNFTCSMDLESNKCKEFPESAEVILKGVAGLHINKCAEVFTCNAMFLEKTENNNSSIDYKNGETSKEQIFDSDGQHSSSLLNHRMLSSHDFSNSVVPSLSPSPSFIVPATSESVAQVLQTDSRFDFNRLTVRAMPDPVGYQTKESVDSDNLSYNVGSNFLNLIHIRENSCEIQDQLTLINTEQTCFENTDSEKPCGAKYESGKKNLSPKVYDWVNPNKLSAVNVCTSFVDNSKWEFLAHLGFEDMKVIQGKIHETSSEKYNEQTIRKTLYPENIKFSPTECKKKLSKSSSLRRYVSRKNLCSNIYDAGTVSDGELSHPRFSSCSLSISDRSSDTTLNNRCMADAKSLGRRVCSWASGFHVLLEDPAGLKSFSEFLKVEFSQENIIFWIACENYRHLSNAEEMARAARKIYSKHLCVGASEPVNVDSYARHIAEEGLNFPNVNIFIPAQKQIFNLMKFDCYQRFLKSSIFKESMMCEMKGLPLPYENGDFDDEKDQQNAEHKLLGDERKKKSLFPWGKLAWAKSGQVKLKGRPVEAIPIEDQKLERKSVKIEELDYARSIDTDATEISNITTCTASIDNKPINGEQKSNEPNVDIAKAEVVLFGLELPNKKTVCVKAKGNKTCEEILGPILRKYGYKIDQVSFKMSSSLKPVHLDCYVSTIDNKCILVQMKNENIKVSDLETLTNHIFEDLMKTQPVLSDDSSKTSLKSFEVYTLQDQVKSKMATECAEDTLCQWEKRLD